MVIQGAGSATALGFLAVQSPLSITTATLQLHQEGGGGVRVGSIGVDSHPCLPADALVMQVTEAATK